MLKYCVNISETDSERTDLYVTSYDVDNYSQTTYDDTLLVTCHPFEVDNRGMYGETLDIFVAYEIENDYDDSDVIDTNTLTPIVLTSDAETGDYTFLAPKYRTINITSISEVEDIDSNGEIVLYWELFFEDGHYFQPDDDISIRIQYGLASDEQIELTELEYVNCKTLLWEINDVDNLEFFTDIIFNSIHNVSDMFTVTRTQTMFKYDFNADFSSSLTITAIRPKVHINIPISEHMSTSLLQQDCIDNMLVADSIRNSIPMFNEMEKNVYHPVIKTSDGFENVTKINFNLHFREHSGNNWTVVPNDGWNFTKYGYNQGQNDKYYSYPETYKSNQSDLLGYLGFNYNDVKYQKNKLQKSFIRLTFFDSPNQSNQTLLATSTIFFNTNKMYSKLMRCQYLPNWYVIESNPEQAFDRISTNMELNTAVMPAEITNDCEKIEKYRLSSQISVQDKYSSYISSEGFYLYLWSDNVTPIPSEIYMKVEFNHAGYGRTIPMMMPYIIPEFDNINVNGNIRSLFKTNDEIKNDWENGGYSAQLYNDYSYLKMKYVYDVTTNRYLYYIDDSVYGKIEGPVLNINLYEARIEF